jgi:DNA invertase Pin-like site-specific DNA recombinase
MGDRARRFLRVSTGKQDESKQLDDVDSYISERGYEDDNRSYLAHGKSAYTGKHLAVLDQAFRDMADEQYDVLILWDSSRFTRMGAGSAFELMARARQAGGRVEFAAPHAQQLNVTSDWSPVMLALQATADKLESDRRRAHTRRDIAKHATTGSVHGKPPWGWKIEGTKDAKRFVPTQQGREFIPKMYKWVIEGTGCFVIAQWLTAQTGHIFNEGTVNGLIRNPLNYGQRRRGGALEAEELVPYKVWQEAVMALESRRAGGGKKRTPNASLFIPVCLACFGEFRPGCNNGLSRMYKYTYPDKPDVPVFRCCGSGPQRRGCGSRTVPLAELEAIVLGVIGNSPQRHMEKIFVPSIDSESVLKDLGRRIAEAAALGDFDAVADLNAQAKAASQQVASRPHYDLKDSGMTKGEYFSSLGPSEQSEYLKEYMIVASYDGERVTAGEVIMSEGDGTPSAVHLWTL